MVWEWEQKGVGRGWKGWMGARGKPHISKRTIDGLLLLHDEAGGLRAIIGIASVVGRRVDT